MIKRFKVCYVIGSLATGGAERQLLELLSRLDRSRYDASLVLFNGATASRADGLVSQAFALNIPSTNNRRPTVHRAALIAAAFWRLERHLRRLRPDIVHAILPTAYVLASPAAKVARVPVVIGSRRALPAQYRRDDSLPATIERFAMRFTDRMLGNCTAVTRSITADGYPAARSDTIYNGVDAERFRPSNSRNWRRVMGWNDGHVVFGTVANFFAYKRHIDVVLAAARLRNSFPQARFVLVGQDRGVMPEVRSKIAELQLDDVIRIVPGTAVPEEVSAALDVYVCPSETEGFSNVLLEAMASGKPVIATEVGGNVELIRDGWNGFIVPASSPDRIAEAASRFLEDSASRAAYGARSRERVEQEFSLTRMLDRYHQLYSNLLFECHKS